MRRTKAGSVLFLVRAGVFWRAGPPGCGRRAQGPRGAGAPCRSPPADNAGGGRGEAFVSLFYTLSFQGGEEGEGLKSF